MDTRIAHSIYVLYTYRHLGRDTLKGSNSTSDYPIGVDSHVIQSRSTGSRKASQKRDRILRVNEAQASLFPKGSRMVLVFSDFVVEAKRAPTSTPSPDRERDFLYGRTMSCSRMPHIVLVIVESPSRSQ